MVPVTGGQPRDPAAGGDAHQVDEPATPRGSNGERAAASDAESDEFGAPSESSDFAADPDDPDLNPDVERASEIDDVTGPVSVITPDTDPSTESGGETPPGDGDAADGADGSPTDDATVTVSAQELDALRTERDEYRVMAQRLQADFDNFRKRSVVQTQAEVERAGGRLIEALLPVLDAAEAAYVEHPDEVGPLLNAMLGELRKHGLETVELEGQPFDPEVAEAVAHEPGSGNDVIVAEVLRSGYRWKDKTLRPAMVRTKD